MFLPCRTERHLQQKLWNSEWNPADYLKQPQQKTGKCASYPSVKVVGLNWFLIRENTNMVWTASLPVRWPSLEWSLLARVQPKNQQADQHFSAQYGHVANHGKCFSFVFYNTIPIKEKKYHMVLHAGRVTEHSKIDNKEWHNEMYIILMQLETFSRNYEVAFTSRPWWKDFWGVWLML